MFVSGGVVLAWMRETHPVRGDYAPSGESDPESAGGD
jgi:hypothetical protein